MKKISIFFFLILICACSNSDDTNNSIAQYNNSIDTGITGLESDRILLESGYTNSNNNVTFSYDSYLSNPIVNSSITGSSRVLSLCGKSLSGTEKVNGSLSWLEIV
jgi:hypothetical protein